MGSCSNKGQNTKGVIQVISANPDAKTDQKIIPSPGLEKIPPKDFTRQNSQLKIEEPLVKKPKKNKEKAMKVFNKQKINSDNFDAPTAVITDPVKTSSDIDLIEKCLKSHFIFNSITDAQVLEVTNAMKLFSLEPNQNIFSENQPGDHFFILASGRAEVKVHGNQVSVLEPGMSFGEGALLQNTPRNNTIDTIEATKLWGLGRNVFKKVVGEMNAATFQENMEIVGNTTIFKDLRIEQKEVLVESLTVLYFNPKAVIIQEGDNGNLLFIIKEGNTLCTKNGQEICRFSKGEFFGEQALFFKTQRMATVSAIDQVKCLAIDSETLTKVLGSKFQTIIYKNSIRMAFKSNAYLKKLSKIQESLLIESMNIRDFDSGAVIIHAGNSKKSDLLVVLKGYLTSSEVTINALKCLGETDIIEDTTET